MAKLTDTDQAAIAAFLAAKQPTKVEPGTAYGVDTETDKARAKAARHEARMADQAAFYEREGERHMERVREAAHTGGRNAAIDAMQDADERLARYSR